MPNTLRQLLDYSKQNPNSDIAIKLRTAIEAGAYDTQAWEEGIDLSPVGRPKKPPTFFEETRESVQQKVEEGRPIAAGLEATAYLPKQIVKTAIDIVPESVKSMAKKLVKPIYDVSLLKPLVETIAPTLQNITEKYPEESENVGNLIEIIGGAFGVKGLSKLPEFAKSLAKKAVQRTRGKEMQRVLELTMPKETKEVRKAAFKAAGRKGGITATGEITPSIRNEEVAQTILDSGIKPSGNVFKFQIDLNNKIAEISQAEVRPFLHNNPAIFNEATLEAKLKEIPLPTLAKAEETLENTYELIRDRAMAIVKEYPHNTEGLWDARIEFDKWVRKEFGEKALSGEKRSVATQASRDMRKAMNKFIIENTPDDVFQELMRKLSNLEIASENLIDRFEDIVGKSKWIKFERQHPKLAATFKVGGWAALGAVGNKIMKEYFGIGL